MAPHPDDFRALLDATELYHRIDEDGDARIIFPLESGRTQNEVMVVPAPRAGERSGGVVVFPNPYRVEARWDAGEGVRNRYMWFANLPPRCTIRIYTLAGDLVYEYDFDGATYNGANARGIYDAAYMEAIGDWFLIYRDATEMMDLASGIDPAELALKRVYTRQSPDIFYLELRRRGALAA